MSLTDSRGNAIVVGNTVVQDSWGYSGAILGNCGDRSTVLALGRTRAQVKFRSSIDPIWVSLKCLRVIEVAP